MFPRSFLSISLPLDPDTDQGEPNHVRTHADPDLKHRLLPCLYIGQLPNYSMSIPFFYVILRGMLCFAKNWFDSVRLLDPYYGEEPLP